MDEYTIEVQKMGKINHTNYHECLRYTFDGVLRIFFYLLSCDILIRMVEQNSNIEDVKPWFFFFFVSSPACLCAISLLFIPCVVLFYKYRVLVEIYLFLISLLIILNFYYIWREIVLVMFYV